MDIFGPARAALATLPGEAGAFASDADGRALFCEGEDELFPSASVIKLPLVMTLYADATRTRRRAALAPRSGDARDHRVGQHGDEPAHRTDRRRPGGGAVARVGLPEDTALAQDVRLRGREAWARERH